MTRRPIDPPDIPAWRRAEARSEDETPTLTSLPGSDVADSEETQWDAVPPSDMLADAWGPAASAEGDRTGDTPADPDLDAPAPANLAPQPLGTPPEDPRDLARRLAAEAKAKIAAASAQPAPEPEPEPEPEPAEDPRELARRLAAEAKARVARTPAPARRQEDPRELARRLAAEAKARTTRTPAPAPRTDEPAEVGMKMAAEARSMAQATSPPTPSYTPPAAPAPAPAPTGNTTSEPSPARRKAAPPASSRGRSAKEILEAALRSEQVTAPPQPSPVPQPTAAPVPEPPPAPETAQHSVVEASPAPSSPPAADPSGQTTWEPQASPAPRPVESPAAALLEMLPGAEVEAPVAVERPDVFKAVWRAHRTRALHERDFAGVAMASALIDACTRVPVGSLVGARVVLDGEAHAVFADVERKALLAVFRPADVYLAGLGAT